MRAEQSVKDAVLRGGVKSTQGVIQNNNSFSGVNSTSESLDDEVLDHLVGCIDTQGTYNALALTPT